MTVLKANFTFPFTSMYDKETKEYYVIISIITLVAFSTYKEFIETV